MTDVGDPALAARAEALRAQAEAATRARVRREAELDAATAAHERALATLRAEFGVSSVAEAAELLARLEDEVRVAMDRAEAQLREVAT